MAFARKYRLRKKNEIKEVFSGGKTVNGSFLFIKYKNNELLNNRFAIIIPAKIIRKAVLRNKLRRKISEAVKKIMLIETKKGKDILIIAGKKIKTDLKLKEIIETITVLVNKIK